LASSRITSIASNRAWNNLVAASASLAIGFLKSAWSVPR
jgi:hypothetical protein